MRIAQLHAVKSPLVLAAREPLTAGSGEVVVRLRRAALNRRDYWITQGLYPGLQLPVVLGSDGAGEVVAAGEGVDPACLGQPVVIHPGCDWGGDEAVQAAEFSILGMPRDGTLVGERRARTPEWLNASDAKRPTLEADPKGLPGQQPEPA